MRFWFPLPLLIVGISLGGWAQTAKPPKVRSSNEFKVNNDARPRSAPAVALAKGSPSDRDLHSIEQERPKGETSRSSTKVPAALLKPKKDPPNPKINFKGTSSGKNAGLNRQGSNPYKGRLKQKGGSH